MRLRFALILALLVLFSSPTARSQSTTNAAPNPLEAAIARLTTNPEYAGFRVGIEVVEIDSGRILFAAGEHQSLNPASNEKIVTTATLLATLHSEYRFETGIYGSSSKGPVISGGLVIRGYGDPSLSRGDLYEMAGELKRVGIHKIDGDILVDQKYYDDLHDPPAYEQQPNEWMPFRAPVAAVSLDENVIVATFRPNAGAGTSISFWPPGFVDVAGSVTAKDEESNVRLTLSPNPQDPFRMHADVAGNVHDSARQLKYERRVINPALLAGYGLKSVLNDMGIEVTGDVKLGQKALAHVLLAEHKSAPLASLLFRVGKNSDNFYAEMLFKAISGEKKGRPASSQASAEIATQFLTSINALDVGVEIKNGSGLFDANRATAHELVTILRYAYMEPSMHPEMLAQLSIAGEDGSLAGRLKGTHRAVRAKTGTLDDAVALSGYVLAPPGKSAIAFSILINDCKGKVPHARGFADKIVSKIVTELLYPKRAQ